MALAGGSWPLFIHPVPSPNITVLQHHGFIKKPSVRLLSSLFNPSCEGSCPRVTLQHGFPTLEKIKWGAVCYKQCCGRCKVTIAASLKQLPCNGNGLFLKVSHGQMVFTGCALLLTPLLKLHSLIYFSPCSSGDNGAKAPCVNFDDVGEHIISWRDDEHHTVAAHENFKTTFNDFSLSLLSSGE